MLWRDLETLERVNDQRARAARQCENLDARLDLGDSTRLQHAVLVGEEDLFNNNTKRNGDAPSERGNRDLAVASPMGEATGEKEDRELRGFLRQHPRGPEKGQRQQLVLFSFTTPIIALKRTAVRRL